MRLHPTPTPFVCRRCCCWPIAPLFFFLFQPHLAFCVPSPYLGDLPPTFSIPPVAAPTPTPAPFKIHPHFAPRITLLAPAASVLLLLLLAITMGCLLKFLRTGFRPRRKTDQTLAAPAAANEQEKDGVRKYIWDELEKMSLNFSQVIGSGGFSTVFLAHLPGPSGLGAIKIHASSEHLNRVFQQELDVLRNLRHQNIVRLLGYCDEQENGALVFEYVPSGSLHEKLHGSGEVLSWRNRMLIAFQLAQALEYLHEKCPLQIVHGDIKSSNILLDQNLNCKLCDFGSAKMGFSSAIMPTSRLSSKKQVMVGSLGYTDPHYLRTGIASKKNDVYSYGVIILELVTGMEAFCEEKGKMLTSVVGPTLRGCGGGDEEAMEVAELVDPRLAADFDVKEVTAMISLSALCLGQSPTLRPSASQILHTFLDKIPSVSFLSSPQKHTPAPRE